MTDYSSQTDENLIAKIHSRSADSADITRFLLLKYKPMVRGLSKDLFILGGDSEDLIQEGMIGLMDAIHDYDGSKDAKFKSFATLCVQRQMYTAMAKANRRKHEPLNFYVSISGGEDGDPMLDEFMENDASVSPEHQVIEQEYWKEFYAELEKHLSKLEQTVLSYCREGMTYTQIADILGKEPKAIDNALQRIRKKVSKWNSPELELTPSGVLSQKKK